MYEVRIHDSADRLYVRSMPFPCEEQAEEAAVRWRWSYSLEISRLGWSVLVRLLG